MAMVFTVSFCACTENKTDSKTEYTVKFSVCAPSGVQTNTIADKQIVNGDVVERPTVVQRGTGGYYITGWYEDESYTQEWDFDIDAVNKDITLYAKWGRKYTVEYYSNQSLESPIYSETVTEGKTVTPSDDVFVGYKVNGYYTDKNHTQVFNANSPVTSDLSVYANTSETLYFGADSIKKNFTQRRALSDSTGEIGVTTVKFDTNGEKYAEVKFGLTTKTTNACIILSGVNVDITKSQKIKITYRNLGNSEKFRFFFVLKDSGGDYVGSNNAGDYDNERNYDYSFKSSEKNMSATSEWATLEIDLASLNTYWKNASYLSALRIDSWYKAKDETDDTNIIQIKSIEGITVE